MKLRTAVSAGAVAALALVGWQLWVSSVAQDEHQRREDDLDALRDALSLSNLHALESRYVTAHYDELTKDRADIRRIRKTLEEQGRAEALLQSTGLDRAISQEEQELEDFKTSQSVLRNSQRWFSRLMGELLEEKGLDPKLRDDLVLLKAELLSYDAGERERAPLVETLLERLEKKSQGSPLKPTLDLALGHARQVLKRSEATDGLLRKLLTDDAAEQASSKMFAAFQQENAALAVRLMVERAVLVMLSLVLLVGVLLTMRALRKKSVALTDALKWLEKQKTEVDVLNHQLEGRVGDRTRELASRNRELEESLLLLRQTRERLALSERMATVGTMAAGVAHEINNPASFILANASFIKDEISRAGSLWPEGGELDLVSGTEMVDAAKSIEQGVERIARIVRDLKTFSRQNDDETMGAVNLTEVLDLAMRMSMPVVRDRAVMVKQFSDLPRVHGDASRLGQVFLNLLVNAAQAMPEKPGNEIRVSAWATGNSVEVEIVDTGTGMSPETLSRIFDPFFTTKTVGEGTGLGLAICHGIIQKHGGSIDVESELGKGSTFRVRLPMSEASEKAAEPEKPKAVGKLKVLVIDDEPRIGDSVRRGLGREHEVDSCTSALAALELIRNGQRFDLILCDLMMPELSGVDFHERLSVLSPEQASKTVFVSGGVTTERCRVFAESVGERLMPKPLDMTMLRTRLAQAAKGARA